MSVNSNLPDTRLSLDSPSQLEIVEFTSFGPTWYSVVLFTIRASLVKATLRRDFLRFWIKDGCGGTFLRESLEAYFGKGEIQKGTCVSLVTCKHHKALWTYCQTKMAW
jgi:hypothetical protein